MPRRRIDRFDSGNVHQTMKGYMFYIYDEVRDIVATGRLTWSPFWYRWGVYPVAFVLYHMIGGIYKARKRMSK